MGSLNSRQRRDRWRKVAWRELHLNTDKGPATYMNVGPYCRGCGCHVSMKGTNGVEMGLIDCIDNKGDHSRLANVQLLCRSCNRKKNPRRAKHESDAPPPAPDEYGRREMSFAARKNVTVEPLFRSYVVSRLASNGGQYDEDSLIKSGAEKFKASIKACTDYMDKLTSDEGPCEVVQGVVYWRDSRDMDAWLESEDGDRRQALRLFLRAKGRPVDDAVI